MIKVLFVYSDRFCSCTRKRTFEVAKSLMQYKPQEISTHVVYFLNLQEKFFKEHDIIILQRLGANGGRISPRYKKELFKFMEKYKNETSYIYDIDDLIFNKQESFPIELMKRCHYTLAPNKFMEKKQKEHNSNTHVIRTHIDLETFDNMQAANGFHDVINIGWFSGNGLGTDIMEQLFPELQKKYNNKIQVHFFAIDPFKTFIHNKYKDTVFISHNLLRIEAMFAVLKSIDFVINPMDYNHLTFNFLGKNTKKDKEDFINCKSEIKYLVAGAAGLPIITTSTPAYRHAIKNGKNGFLAENNNDWLKYIDLLINNVDKRKKIGLKAKEDIFSNYSLKNTADNYYKFFKTIIKDKA